MMLTWANQTEVLKCRKFILKRKCWEKNPQQKTFSKIEPMRCTTASLQVATASGKMMQLLAKLSARSARK